MEFLYIFHIYKSQQKKKREKYKIQDIRYLLYYSYKDGNKHKYGSYEGYVISG